MGAETTKSFHIFEQTLGRSRGMLQLAKLYNDMLARGEIEEHNFLKVSDLARASIVISVSAMDSYFTRKFAEILVPYIRARGPTPGIIRVLEKAGLDTAQALTLLTMARPFRRVRTLVEGYLDRVVVQKFRVIDELMLCFGLKNFSENIQKSTGLKRTLRSIEILIERRHSIVHEGDVDSKGRLKSLNIAQTERRIKELARFVWCSERIINKRIQKLEEPKKK